MEKAMAPHSSTVAQKIPWTAEPRPGGPTEPQSPCQRGPGTHGHRTMSEENGSISFQEFLEAMAAWLQTSDMEGLREIFRAFDQDDDGYISVALTNLFLGPPRSPSHL